MDIKAYENITKGITNDNATEIVAKLLDLVKKDAEAFSVVTAQVEELTKKNNDLRDSNTYLVSHYVTAPAEKEEEHEKTVEEMTPEEAIENFIKAKGGN